MRYVQDPLAGRLLRGEFGPGDTILIDAEAVRGDSFRRSDVDLPEENRLAGRGGLVT